VVASLTSPQNLGTIAALPSDGSLLVEKLLPAPITTEGLAEQLPTYRLSCSRTTIPDLWREWTVGLGRQLLVEVLDEHYYHIFLRYMGS
jgi:Transcriptional activator of glycolytic enzymes